mmetsp:Transcript_2024/g.12991  ORF Transcript_2024/g.12991 Transcript_2024/m.12991 type:complete len:216 (-) Transcript_2024:235-882(-)
MMDTLISLTLRFCSACSLPGFSDLCCSAMTALLFRFLAWFSFSLSSKNFLCLGVMLSRSTSCASSVSFPTVSDRIPSPCAAFSPHLHSSFFSRVSPRFFCVSSISSSPFSMSFMLPASSTPQSTMCTRFLGFPSALPIPSMALTTSIPDSTCPKTTCFPSSHGVATVVMKNWLPLVLGPALAMDRTPARSCRSTKFSSWNFPPNADCPPVPSPRS